MIRWNGKDYSPRRYGKAVINQSIEELMKPLSEKKFKGNVWRAHIIGDVQPTGTAIPDTTPTPTPSNTPTGTPGPSPSPTQTSTPTTTLTSTPTPTTTLTATPTQTQTQTPTTTITLTPTNTTTPTNTPTPSGVPSGTTEANAYLTAVVNAGGTGIDSTVSAATRTLFTSLVSNGLYSKMIAMYPMLGGNAAGTKFNAINPVDTNAAMRLVFGGGWTYNSTGILPNGTNAFANTIQSPQDILTPNNWHMSYYSRTNTAYLSSMDMGATGPGASSSQALLALRQSTNVSYFDAGGVSTQKAQTTQTDSRGYYIGSIVSSSSRRYWKNGAQIWENSTPFNNSLPEWSILIGCAQQTGLGIINPGNKECAFATIGVGLTTTEMETLSTIVNTWATAIGRNTY
jgi:hypothetical protein